MNDMPGYGQALLAMFGVMYFAVVLGAILMIFAASVLLHRRKGSTGG